MALNRFFDKKGDKSMYNDKEPKKTAAIKVIGTIKSVLIFMAEIWPLISYCNITLAVMMALLWNVFSFFGGLVKTEISLPVIVLVAIFPLLLYAIITLFIQLVRQIKNTMKKRNYKTFDTMYFKDWLLTWTNKFGKNKKHITIEDLHPICPECKCNLVPVKDSQNDSKTQLYCSMCNKLYKYFIHRQIAKTRIEHIINNHIKVINGKYTVTKLNKAIKNILSSTSIGYQTKVSGTLSYLSKTVNITSMTYQKGGYYKLFVKVPNGNPGTIDCIGNEQVIVDIVFL